jgi:hypothetical protein
VFVGPLNMRSREDIKNEGLAALAQGGFGAAAGASLGLPALIAGNERLQQWASDGKGLSSADDIADKALQMLEAGGFDGDIIVNTKGKTVPEFISARKGPNALHLPIGITPEIMAHEVGHATQTSKLDKAIHRLGVLASKKPMLALPSLMASAALADDPYMGAISKAAPWVGGGMLAATLAEEARANIKGAKILEALGTKMPMSKKLRLFLPAAAYLGAAGLLVGAPAGIRKGILAQRKSTEEGLPIPPNKYPPFSTYVPSQVAALPRPEEVTGRLPF